MSRVLLFADMNHDLIDETTGTFPDDLFASVFAWTNPRLGGESLGTARGRHRTARRRR